MPELLKYKSENNEMIKLASKHNYIDKHLFGFKAKLDDPLYVAHNLITPLN